MKNLKKLSLEDEINREAEEIEKKVKENKEIEGMTVSEDMETALFNKIQEYEYDKRLKKVVYRKKKRTYVIGAIAAIIILICGSVMTSVGSKSYVKVLWERINGDESSNIINVEDMDSKKTKDVDEDAAYKELTKTFGDYLVRLGYYPQDMRLSRYTVDEQQRQATLFYEYRDEVVRYSMYLNDDDSSFGQKEVDNEVDKYTETCGDITIEVKVYQTESTGRLRYVAKFERYDVHYQLMGTMERAEFDKILKILTKHDITSRNYILKLCPDRVHTIIPGMMVVKEIMDRLNCKELWVSRYGVREGYLCKNFLMTGSTQEVTK